MRLAMVTTYPLSATEPVGGVQAVTVCLVRALLRRRPDIDLHVIRCPAEQEGVTTREGDCPHTIHHIPGRRTCIGLRAGKALERKLRELAPDVVHVHAFATEVDARRYPAVLTIHGIVERDTLFRPHRFRRLRALLLARLNKPARRRYRHVILVSGYVLRYLEKHIRGQCHFIPNPVEKEFFDLSRQDAGPRVLFIGSVIPLKNPYGLIQGMALLAGQGVEFSLHLAGPRPMEGYARSVEALVDECGLRDRVEFLGHLDRPALQEQISRARCIVLPSFQETAGLVIAEGAAAGVPAVVAPSGGAAEMVSHGHSGIFVDPNSPRSIAEGIRPLLEDARLAEQLGRRARERAECYRPACVAEKTLAVYDAVMRD